MTTIDYGLMNTKAQGWPGPAYTMAATTGIMAAALGSASNIFSYRVSTISTNTLAAMITAIRLQFTTTTAFTTPAATGRRLALYRVTWGSGTTAGGYAMPSANHTAVNPVKKDSNAGASILTAIAADPEWAGAHIATTAGMTIGAGMVVAADPFRTLNLSHVGAAGANHSVEWVFTEPIILPRGTGFVIRNPAAMDAAGVWHLNVDVDWNEARLY